jgi:lipopolysaccharide/colanic/teichoic acid biosynthesis glycosyltransferase
LLVYRNYCYKKGFWAKNTLIIDDDSTGLKHLTKRHNAPIHSINIYELALSDILYKGYVEVLLLLKKPKSLQVLKNESYKFSDQVLYKIPAELAIEYHDEYHFEYYHDQDFFSFSLEVMPTWQKNFKRIVDIIFSITGLVLLSPIMIFSAIKISLSSPGPIFFKQTRVGKNRRLFEIIKFRSMYLDSEKDGPTLSFSGDERCTPWGKFMRTYRIDEIPQLWNVIKGDMSIVGPRPERPFFLSQLTEYSDQLNRIYAVRPGITSWGQVKYGYASDISQMLKRLKFDFLYLDNRSVFLDFRIMFLTLAVILKGEGK